MVFNVDDMITKDKKKIPTEEKKMGRPKKKEENLKTERVVCYLTKKELKELEDMKNSNELNDLAVSNYVRKILINHIKS